MHLSDIELLAPAGGPEQLDFALRFGADAVYLAADRFGMRQRAKNFTLENLGIEVECAHRKGARVYVTVNVVVHEDDVDELIRYLRALDEIGVDALIIGDLGAFTLAKQHAPNCELHVSTQASVSNAVSAKAYYDMGAKRIVLARELSIGQIATMREKLPDDLEFEAFVHGSMCMAYSGRCLISDYLTGRSALTGHCTQSCRWSYTLEEEKRPGEHFPIEQDGHGSYILNACDLNMLEHLDDLAAAGVTSFKIEGRNKKAFYVASVVNAYRQVMDGADASIWEKELELVSHRPYSTGFYFGPAHQADMTDERDQQREWVAEVLLCDQCGDGIFSAVMRCRNSFCCDDALEVLSPHSPISDLHISYIEHIPVDSEPRCVARANRNMEHYRVICDRQLESGDLLRKER